MRKLFVFILATIVFAGVVMVPVANSEVRTTLGSFVEIRHEEYMNENQ